MTFKILRNKITEVILLLFGLFVFQMILNFTLPLVIDFDYDFGVLLLRNSSWIGNGIFGLTILWLTRSRGLVAIPVAILSIVLPIYGPIFYILTTLQKKNND